VLLESIEAREPVLGLAIEPESAKDEGKLLEALNKLVQEDPTLRLEEDEETGQRVLRGMGELHLQIQFERIQREYKLSVRAGKPDVVLRESISATATAEGLFHRTIQAGDKTIEMKGWAKVTVAPRGRGEGTVVDAESPKLLGADKLTPALAESIANGASDAAITGPEGSPLQDLSVTVDAVELFGEPSTPQAMRVAVAEATRKALAQARPVVLRPIMKTEVVVPSENLGSVLGDLQSRGALIHETEAGEICSIRCDCALDKLLGYTTALRSMTRGRGSFAMEFDRFDVL
jgi:elongation factor G